MMRIICLLPILAIVSCSPAPQVSQKKKVVEHYQVSKPKEKSTNNNSNGTDQYIGTGMFQ